MADLVPIPFATLLRRAHHELRTTRSIFDLPVRKFYAPPDGEPRVDLSVAYAGRRAHTPVGPAAGPHTQLAQNIALCWLAGSRVIELKTVQINDRLQLTRPCIDMATIGYNTEWSQELTLDQSLREYVKASMLIALLDAARVLGAPGGPTLFDISVGYNLKGITSPAMRAWLTTMREAADIVEDLRREIPAEFKAYRDLPFATNIAHAVTLSTFHGTPAEDIERIGEFLIKEFGLHTIIKLNPPMLGRERVGHLLHDVLGYRDVEVNPACFEDGLPFDEAVDLLARLQTLASAHGVTAGIKCGNTLEVINTRGFLQERIQYLSGAPLHALHVQLAADWRRRAGADLQISFSAGVDAANVADCVAAGLVPVTTCTDLLRPGGYGRLAKYLTNLEGRLLECGARTIDEFILTTASSGGGPPERTAAVLGRAVERQAPAWHSGSGAGSDSSRRAAAVLANTERLLSLALTDERYRAARIQRAPRKLNTHLRLWDCLTCGKCVPACPNDAVFEIDVEPFVGEVPVIEASPDGWRERERTLYRALKSTQLVTFADACNACGNCDVFCPEDGGPHIEKARFFGSIASWLAAAPLPGFVVSRESEQLVIRGRYPEGGATLRRTRHADEAVFTTAGAAVTVDWDTHQIRAVDWKDSARPVDMSQYMTLRILLDACSRSTRVNFVTAALLD